MYKLHLIWKYLRKRRIAWVSLLAVTLCTAMVLVVISVMGGWLRTFRTSFRGLSGDIVVANASLSGFGYYDEMIAEIQKVPGVAGASPVIETFGLININARKTTGVRVMGYPIGRIGKVNPFPTTLWRQYNQWKGWLDGDPIPPEDRDRLIEYEKVPVRSADEVLRLTPEETKRLREFLPKAPEVAKSLQATADQTAALDERDSLTYASILAAQIIPDAVRPGGSGTLSAGARKAIRQHIGGNLVDDPDDRLRATDAEKKLIEQYGTKLAEHPSFDKFYPPDFYRRAFQNQNPKAKQQIVDESANWDGIICSTGVVQVHKDRTGKFVGRDNFLYRIPVSLTVIGVPTSGSFDLSNKAERNYWIVDTSQTKVWQFDADTVYVPFEVVQRDLGMEPQTREEDGKQVTSPARCTHVYIKVADELSDGGPGLKAVATGVQAGIDKVLTDKARAGTPLDAPRPVARTWEESQYKWLAAIEKEKTLVTFLFSMISVVAIFLVFCIFYMIVVEKTRDIGIIKSVGATSSGVAGIFLGYGAVIGVVGAGLGFLAGYLVVHNINTLHTWLTEVFHVQVWDPEVYAFDTIPNTMDPTEVTVILGAAIVSSILGALVPAVIAAGKHPVEALRWE